MTGRNGEAGKTRIHRQLSGCARRDGGEGPATGVDARFVKPRRNRGKAVNRLYYGDNLDVLRRHIAGESVDLVYLDPPFNSNASYNVLFAEQDGTRAAAQIQAFEDTWQWDEAAARTYQETVEKGGSVSAVLQAFRTFLGDNNMLAYLSMMAARLVELRRVLRDDGSIYLHCDPTAGHYLKMLMDAVFGPENFRSEIVWKRSSAHSDTRQGRKDYGHIHERSPHLVCKRPQAATLSGARFTRTPSSYIAPA